jgi:predicted nucleic acid-binding protein
VQAETRADVVLDANVAHRALLDADGTALGWIERIRSQEIRAAWPDLAFIELANGLQMFVRHRGADPARARLVLAAAFRLPIVAAPLLLLAPRALNVAIERSLTAYDASYVVLAEQLRATLVTADRKLAAATPNAVLLD